MLNSSFTNECNHIKDNNSDINSSKDNNPHVYPIPYSALDDNLHPGSEIIQRNLFINNAIQFHLINKTIQHHHPDRMDLNDYTLPTLVPLAPTSKDIQTKNHSHACNCKVGRNNPHLSALSPFMPYPPSLQKGQSNRWRNFQPRSSLTPDPAEILTSLKDNFRNCNRPSPTSNDDYAKYSREHIVDKPTVVFAEIH